MTRHHYGISAFVSRTPFLGETSGGVAKCRLLSQASGLVGCANIALGCIVDNMLVLLILVTVKRSVGEEILLNSKIVFSTNKSFSLP